MAPAEDVPRCESAVIANLRHEAQRSWRAPGAEALPELLAAAAADRQLGAVDEPGHPAPVAAPPELAHAREVDDRRAVDASEGARVELGLERADRLAMQVGLAADVERDVVALRLDPVDVAGGDDRRATAELDQEALERRVAVRR